jgi:hypothetical protein
VSKKRIGTAPPGARPVAAQKKATAAEVEDLSRKAVDKAVAQDRRERGATVATLSAGNRVTRGIDKVRGVVYAVTKGWAIIDWGDGEREGWNDKALKRGKVAKK